MAKVRDAHEAVLKDPALGLPEEQETPSLPLAVGMRVRFKPMGVTGEVMALQGDKAELAISGKRLKVATSELVSVPGGVWGAQPPQDKESRAMQLAPPVLLLSIAPLRVPGPFRSRPSKSPRSST